MTESGGDALKKLEEAVEQWSAQVAGAQEGLAEQLGRARAQLDAASGHAGALTSLPALVEGLRKDLEALRTRPQDSPEGLGALHGELRALREDLRKAQPAAEPSEGLATALEDLRKRVEALQRDVAGLRGDLALVPRLVQRLEDLRRAAEQSGGGEPAHPGGLRRHTETWREVALLRAQLEEDAGLPQPFVSGRATDLERLAYDDEGNRRRMGEILLTARVVTPDQLEEALGEQERLPFRRLGSILLEKGHATEESIARALAGQARAPFIRIDQDRLPAEAANLISARMARHHACVPVRADEERLTLAMANPFDLVAIDDVELASHRRVEAVVATPSDIEAAITRLYGPQGAA